MEPWQEWVFGGSFASPLRIENEFLTRDLNDMVIYRSTVDGWAGQSMAHLYQRYQVWLAHSELVDDAEEARTFAAMGTAIRDDGEFFLRYCSISIGICIGSMWLRIKTLW